MLQDLLALLLSAPEILRLIVSRYNARLLRLLRIQIKQCTLDVFEIKP